MLGVEGPQRRNRSQNKTKQKEDLQWPFLGTYSESLFHNRRHLIRGCPARKSPERAMRKEEQPQKRKEEVSGVEMDTTMTDHVDWAIWIPAYSFWNNLNPIFYGNAANESVSDHYTWFYSCEAEEITQ